MAMRFAERNRRDPASVSRRRYLEDQEAREAEMERRGVLGHESRRIELVCPSCHQRGRFEIGNGVPVVQCPNCSHRLVIRPGGGYPQVVSR